MVSSVTTLLWLLASVALVAAHSGTSRPRYIPNSFIVKFDDQHVAANSLERVSEAFELHLATKTWPAFEAMELKHRHDIPDVFQGATVSVSPSIKEGQTVDTTTAQAMRILKQAPGVVKVIRDQYLYLDQPIRRSSPDFPASGDALNPRDFNERTDFSAFEKDPSLAHRLMGVDIQHRKGNFGQNITVCIIESIPDYSHPALNGGRPSGQPCLGDGCQVIGGLDWTNGHEKAPIPPSLVNISQCSHATATAGIVGSRIPAFPGVAPGVNFRAYRIFPCVDNGHSVGGTELSLLVYEQVAKDGCQVISGSYGGDSEYRNEFSEATDALSRKGITGVFSVGNNGGAGLFTLQFPAIGADTLAAGAARASTIPAFELTIDPPLSGGKNSIEILSDESWTFNGRLPAMPIVFTQAALDNPDIHNDGCVHLNETVPNLKGKVLVLFRSTGCGSNRGQLGNAAGTGATALLLINYEGGQPFAPINYYGRPMRGAAMMFRPDGLALYEAYKKNKKNKNIKVTFSPDGPFAWHDIPVFEDTLPTIYSNKGPDNDGNIKPDLLTIGGQFIAPVSLPDKYAVVEGTSFACPQLSGGIALYKAVKGADVDFFALRKAFYQSARPLHRSKSDRLESVFNQGAGLMNVTAAIELTTSVEPVKLELRETGLHPLRETLEVTNHGTTSQSYKVSHVAAQSLLALQDGAPNHRFNESESIFSNRPHEIDDDADVVFDPVSFDLDAGATQQVKVTIHPPAPHPRMNIFSGYLRVTSSSPERSASVPYGGQAGKFSSIPSILSGRVAAYNVSLPALIVGSNDTITPSSLIHDDTRVFSLDPNDPMDHPSAVFILQTGTPLLLCHIVHANVSFHPTITEQDGKTRFTPPPKSEQGRKLSATHLVAENLNYWNQSRDYYGWDFETFAAHHTCDASRIMFDPYRGDNDVPLTLPEGKYRFLVRAQRWHVGGAEYESSYNSWISHAWEYRKKKKEEEEGSED